MNMKYLVQCVLVQSSWFKWEKSLKIKAVPIRNLSNVVLQLFTDS